ncbi:hypothetical protein EC12264_A0006 [Escherichia coli 1.2264]|nr:hypothetical protein EC12264_A0006 [Escherichia coli 1.2264]
MLRITSYNVCYTELLRTLKAGKNLSVKQSNGDFTFSVIDTPSFSSVQLNGNGKTEM